MRNGKSCQRPGRFVSWCLDAKFFHLCVPKFSIYWLFASQISIYWDDSRPIFLFTDDSRPWWFASPNFYLLIDRSRPEVLFTDRSRTWFLFAGWWFASLITIYCVSRPDFDLLTAHVSDLQLMIRVPNFHLLVDHSRPNFYLLLDSSRPDFLFTSRWFASRISI